MNWVAAGSVLVVSFACFACAGEEFAASGGSGGAVSDGAGATGGTSAGSAGVSGSAGGSRVDAAGGAGGDGVGGGSSDASFDGVAGSIATGGFAGGTDASPCLDEDGDGFTTCDNDCDDADSTIFPGAQEICGDGADNDCDGDADPTSLCNGKGTWVSATQGDDSNPGTKPLPVMTINQGVQNALGLAKPQPVYVASGHYPEKVVLVEGVSLLGGYECGSGGPCTWDRNFGDTAILAQDWAGTVAGPGITRATTIEGFRLQGLDGTPTGSQYPEGIALTIDQAAPMVFGNTINGGAISGCSSPCGSVAVSVDGLASDPAGALIASNTVNAGDSPNWSIGIAAGGGARVVITLNAVQGGLGDWSRAITTGGPGSEILVTSNDIEAGSCVGQGTAFAMFVGNSTTTIDKNRINLVGSGSCNNPPAWNGGIEGGPGTATITNNVIRGMNAPRSAAVVLRDGEQPLGNVVLNGNTLDGAGNANSAALVLGPLANGSVAFVGEIANNILLGTTATNRVGVFEESVPGETIHPIVLENCDFFFTNRPGATNTAYRFWDGANVSSIAVVQLNASASVNAANNFSADPNLDGTFHLQDPSMNACVNAGTLVGAPSDDMDGDPRPVNGVVDVGADEAG